MLWKKPLTTFLFLISTLGLATLGAQSAMEWIGSFSSADYDGDESEEKDKLVHSFWQIQSLKKAIPPRYVRITGIPKDSNLKTKEPQAILKGVLFTYEGSMSRNVQVCGEFGAWKCHSMTKNPFGIYYTIVSEKTKDLSWDKNGELSYKFKVDGLYELDPTNPQTKIDPDSMVEFSKINLPKFDTNKQARVKVLDGTSEEPFLVQAYSLEEDDHIGDKNLSLRTVEFQIYAPQAIRVSLLGDFNQYNPEHDLLTKGRDGIFRLTKRMHPGTYHYYFHVDGEPKLDLYNPDFTERTFVEEEVSVLEVPEVKFTRPTGKPFLGAFPKSF